MEADRGANRGGGLQVERSRCPLSQRRLRDRAWQRPAAPHLEPSAPHSASGPAPSHPADQIEPSQVFLIYSTHLLHLCPVTFYHATLTDFCRALIASETTWLTFALASYVSPLRKTSWGLNLIYLWYLNICGLTKGGNLATYCRKNLVNSRK